MAGNKRLVLVIVVVLLLLAAAAGCKKQVAELEFDSSGDKPVIVYKQLQAIAPIYNPGAPVAIVYGDDTIIEKEDPYMFRSGKISGDGVSGILYSLSDEGFFGLDKEYKGKPVAGGTTEVLTVNLKDKTTTVSVQAGEGPSGWNKMVRTVTRAKTDGLTEYVPGEVVLYAGETEQPPEGARIMDWPGEEDELAKAAAAGSKGLRLDGPEAANAWRAVRDSLEDQVDVSWRAGGRYYTYVYASPVFPGI